MGGLIKDLLVLSKVSRADLLKNEVNISDMVRDIISEFEETGSQQISQFYDPGWNNLFGRCESDTDSFK
jgi:signal transduction histidine kinase